MGSGISHLIPCIKPEDAGGAGVAVENRNNHQHQVWFEAEEQLDGTLGHSFCYIPSSARFLSPTPSDRFLSPTQSFRLSPSHARSDSKPRCAGPETGFRAISGASVSANTSTPRTFFQLDGVYDDSNDFSAAGVGGLREYGSIVNGFESTSSFSALPLQPVPRGERTGAIEGGGFFLSGPIERGALSGPLDLSAMDGADSGSVPFSAPLGGGGSYAKNNNKKRRHKSFSGIKKAFQRSLSEKKRPWVVPVRNFAGRKELAGGGARDVAETQTGGGRIGAAAASMVKNENDTNVQWALGKAGEDRVHVVISEEHGWLFVGIYDGFNGPDAPEFLMSHLYRAVFHELKGLFWDNEENCSGSNCNLTTGGHHGSVNIDSVNGTFRVGEVDVFDGRGISSSTDNEIFVESIKENPVLPGENDHGSVKRVTFQSENKDPKRKLWEFLAEDDAEDGLDLSGSERFAFSVDEAVSVSNAGTSVDKRTLLLSKVKQGISRKKDECGMSLFPWRFGSEVEDKIETGNKVEERTSRNCVRKMSAVNHGMVLRALSQALEKTELAYLDLTDKVIDQYPELAVMGSCLLAVLMRENDVYVMNLGDSRAIVAQLQPNAKPESENDIGTSSVGLVEDPVVYNGKSSLMVAEAPAEEAANLIALQLSTDHSTNIEEEVLRIKRDHPNDAQCIVNGRVKGRLKVTRAFGAGYLKEAKWNAALLEMFRNEFVGTAPYISCVPSLCHYKIGSRDQFLVLSSDGLYQYLSNQEVVSLVANFLQNNQDGDPAQHLIEELLARAAKKAAMGFHELLDIPHGDRRKYHDDVTVMVISLEGRIWKSYGKYP